MALSLQLIRVGKSIPVVVVLAEAEVGHMWTLKRFVVVNLVLFFMMAFAINLIADEAEDIHGGGEAPESLPPSKVAPQTDEIPQASGSRELRKVFDEVFANKTPDKKDAILDALSKSPQVKPNSPKEALPALVASIPRAAIEDPERKKLLEAAKNVTPDEFKEVIGQFRPTKKGDDNGPDPIVRDGKRDPREAKGDKDEKKPDKEKDLERLVGEIKKLAGDLKGDKNKKDDKGETPPGDKGEQANNGGGGGKGEEKGGGGDPGGGQPPPSDTSHKGEDAGAKSLAKALDSIGKKKPSSERKSDRDSDRDGDKDKEKGIDLSEFGKGKQKEEDKDKAENPLEANKAEDQQMPEIGNGAPPPPIVGGGPSGPTSVPESMPSVATQLANLASVGGLPSGNSSSPFSSGVISPNKAPAAGEDGMMAGIGQGYNELPPPPKTWTYEKFKNGELFGPSNAGTGLDGLVAADGETEVDADGKTVTKGQLKTQGQKSPPVNVVKKAGNGRPPPWAYLPDPNQYVGKHRPVENGV